MAATGGVSNAERIVLALDNLLEREVPLVVYGRAAIALGYESVPDGVKLSLDVDVILRFSEGPALDVPDPFWSAQVRVNEQLKKEGLYMTHMFVESQVFLRPDWAEHIVPVLRPETRWLKLFRPHSIDLILTKMMRGDDPQDMEDISFIVRHDGITLADMEPAFANVRMPEVVELRDAFDRALPVVRGILERGGAEA